MVVGAMASLVLAACGGGGGAKGDRAEFNIDGTLVTVTEHGTGTVHVDDAPPLDYSGPLGCFGRYLAPPDACRLLTSALAARTLSARIGRQEHLKFARFDTTCTYRTDLKFVEVHVSDGATLESEKLWHYPAVSGLGVPAHAAPAADGLVAVKGGVGIEVTVDLGVDGSQTADTAAEVRVARAVLARLHR